MSYVILDLEWNGSFSRSANRFVNEIIEFGAVKIDDELNITDEFSMLVKPRIGKRVSGKVRQLTKITTRELRENGSDFLSVAAAFSKFLGDATVMTWGTSDIHALIDNYSFHTGDYHIPFLRSYCDLQEFCERALGRYDEGNQMGLGTCAELIGMEYSEEDLHRAFADAYLSLECLKLLRDRYPLEASVLNAENEEFYSRMMFRNFFITDLRSPQIDRSQLKFRCDVCGKPAKRVKKWKLHNKNFTADFRCSNCGREFTGRISFKQKYDGVKVNKRIVEKAEKKQEEKTPEGESL